jgi:hypothetical protein
MAQQVQQRDTGWMTGFDSLQRKQEFLDYTVSSPALRHTQAPTQQIPRDISRAKAVGA